MLILLSPAKQLDFEPARPELETSQPALLTRTAELSKTTSKLSRTQLRQLMHISDDLAALNVERFKAFDPESQDGKAAALAFAGEVYRGLDAGSLSKDDLQWAQDHLRILSGLYGALRPLDAIQPYRLEMGTRLKTKKGANLYDFWGDDIAQELTRTLEGHAHPVIVNLASNEYAKAARLTKMKARVITVDFKEEKDGQLRALMVYAKKARGLMARWIIENRVEDPAALTRFNVDGYKLDKAGSKPDRLLFTRPQPPLKKG
ncbi:peroxide stress protein YaaA [Glycocaulis sp.]|uniref:peroxide stress protein YaaA n=1 Tax=Glycocaulis sp. TaxID=1969725 RepID=UPI003D1D0A8F